jgi:hypothetical protein
MSFKFFIVNIQFLFPLCGSVGPDDASGRDGGQAMIIARFLDESIAGGFVIDGEIALAVVVISPRQPSWPGFMRHTDSESAAANRSQAK